MYPAPPVTKIFKFKPFIKKWLILSKIE